MTLLDKRKQKKDKKKSMDLQFYVTLIQTWNMDPFKLYQSYASEPNFFTIDPIINGNRGDVSFLRYKFFYVSETPRFFNFSFVLWNDFDKNCNEC